MLKVSFYFQVHQPFRLRNYLFFDIGNKHNYYNGALNRAVLRRVISNSYMPANRMFHKLIRKYGDKVRVNYVLSGTLLDQLEKHSPEMIDSFQRLLKTGQVELLGTTHSHSLSFLKEKEVFSMELQRYHTRVKDLFDVEPRVFSNTCLTYTDDMAKTLTEHGYLGVLTEGAESILKGMSSNQIYRSVSSPSLKLLLRHYHLSDDISLRFSNRSWNQWPLLAETYLGWLRKLDKKDKILNLWMDYGALGEHQKKGTGIFDFMEQLFSSVAMDQKISLSKASDLLTLRKRLHPMSVEGTVSCSGDRTISPWLENDMQKEAFDTLYRLYPRVAQVSDPEIHRDWSYLQGSDHFYYMSTKYEGEHSQFSPYGSPYDAFINYMNVLSDFALRTDAGFERTVPEDFRVA